jgi:hypothetical protein
MSLSSFTTEVARNHSELKIDALEEDYLWSNGKQWMRVSQDPPILYSSNADRWKVFYEWQIDALVIYPPPPPDPDETIGFTCNMDMPTPPVLRTSEALRKLDVEELIWQIYYGSTAEFVMASLGYQKLSDDAYIERIDSLDSYIRKQMNHEYYVYTCSVDNFNFERTTDLFKEGNYMNKMIKDWLESQLADLESQGEIPQ